MQDRRTRALCVLVLVLLAPVAQSCPISSGIADFAVPAGTPVEAAAGELAAPELQVVSITRGVGERHASCDDVGLLTLQLYWPRGNDYKLRDIGFRFQAIGADTGYAIFPAGAVSGKVDGRKSQFVFMWRDGAPSTQRPLDFEVEVRAVTRGNVIGPPTRLRIASAPSG